MSKTKYTLSFDIKPLNEEQYSAAPEAVRRVYISVLENIPLQNEELKTTIKAHPEYFTLKDSSNKPDAGLASRGTGKTFGDNSVFEIPKTFGQNVKRLFALKGALKSALEKKSGGSSFMKFMPGRHGTIQGGSIDYAYGDWPDEKFMTGPGKVEFSGEVTGEAAESTAGLIDYFLQEAEKGMNQRALQRAFRNGKLKK